MNKGTALVATLIAVTSFPVLAQQPSSANQSNLPGNHPSVAGQSVPGQTAPGAQTPGAQATPPESGTPGSEPTAVAMKPVDGELISSLDSKTAKVGDNVVIQTKASVKTADGTEIPKGSKLMGHVVAAQASAAGAGSNSQMALEFDHVELKGGQNLAVHSQIQSISPAGGGDTRGGAMSAPPAEGSANTSSPNGGSRAGNVPQGTSAGPGAAPAAGGAPAAGTVVARNGSIAISATAIPGVLIANNAPGQQDPRMAKASSILLGAKKDIQLDNGTQVVVGLAAAGGGQ